MASAFTPEEAASFDAIVQDFAGDERQSSMTPEQHDELLAAVDLVNEAGNRLRHLWEDALLLSAADARVAILVAKAMLDGAQRKIETVSP